MRNTIFGLIIVIFIMGCGTTIEITKLNPPPKQTFEKSPESVEVFTVGKPKAPYTEVSLISAQQASDMSIDSTPKIIQKMRDEGAKMGCDALIINMSNDQTIGGTFGSSGQVYGSMATLKGFHGTCVVYNQ